MADRFQFRMSSFLLAVAFLAMTIAIVNTRQELFRLKAALKPEDVSMPIQPTVVAAKLQNYLADHPLSGKVTDVRYSKNEDSFRVQFIWTSPTDKQQHGTDVTLTGDGYGHYTGCIRNPNFLAEVDPIRYATPLAKNDGMWVAVSTPSTIN